MAELARREPTRALGQLLSLAELAELPDAVRLACEQPLSVVGSIDLRWRTGLSEAGEHTCQHQFMAFAGDRSWRVNGPDYREARPPRADVAIDGHVIDGELLVGTSAVRKLEAADLAAAGAWFPEGNVDRLDPVTGNPAGRGPAALIGGKIYRFENDAVIEQVIVRLEAADREAGAAQVYKPEHGFRWLEADGGAGVGNEDPAVAAAPLMKDNVQVLFIRIDFSDKTGAPVSQGDLETSLGAVDGHIQNYSYNSASVSSTVSSQLYRMPSPSTTYTNSSNGSALLMTAARNAAAANYNLSDYDIVGVYFTKLTGSDFNYAGLASIGGGDHWINGLTTDSSRVSVIVHEFGHNYGLYHANYWDPGQQIGGTYTGASLEYGDIFDRMGSGSDPATGFFNPYATSRLEWLPQGKIAEPTADATYRIHRFDAATAVSNPLLALRVPMGGNEYWWVGHRKLFPGIANSAYVVAEGIYQNRPNLIDMTPGSQSPDDRIDAGLPVGSEYYVAAKGVRFRTIASGGTAPNEWIDVRVEFDTRISLAETALEVDEQAGSAVMTLRRSFGSDGIATVNYATADGTATAGSDYYGVSGTVSWADGDMADKQVLVPIRPDVIDDGGEYFTFTLSGAVGGTLVASQSVATVTLRDAGQRLTAFTATFFNTTVDAIAPLADGRVLIGGVLDDGITGNIARLNADGSEDAGFLKGSGFNGRVSALVVQDDGKILVGGEFTSYGGTPCNRLVRLHADGTVDSDFLAAMDTGADAPVRAIAVESTGKILVGGEFANFSGGSMEGLVRLTSAGARDIGSPLTLPFEVSWNTRIKALIAQDDGKIMAVGSFYADPGATGFRSGIARLNSNGSRDTSFDPDAGLHGVGQTNSLRTGEAIVRQADGKYLVGGFFTAYDENPVSHLVRVHANGAYDHTFVSPVFDSAVYTLLLQDSGAVVVGGIFSSRLERLLASGGVDPLFFKGSGPSSNIFSLAGGDAGAIWVGGNFFNYGGTSVRPVVKIAGGVSAYDLWVAGNFTASQIASGDSHPAADPDGDGINNLAEMALGTSPVVFDSNNPFAPQAGSSGLVTSGLADYFQATFARSGSNPGVWLTAQFSSDLGSWQPADPVPGPNAIYDIVEDSPTRFTVRDKTPAGDGTKTRFMRFLVQQPH